MGLMETVTVAVESLGLGGDFSPGYLNECACVIILVFGMPSKTGVCSLK